ncbi:MAG TPA: autotransporter-associated beta strand repeat-containing protein, partial [Pirellulaceae bacterium]|nr:autotransporter-associated beta strand repeat-containing protein [Pirellulaceae bacterium]
MTNPENRVAKVAVSTEGMVTINDPDGFTIGSVDGVVGVVTTGGGANFTTTAVTVNAPIDIQAGTVAFRGAAVTWGASNLLNDEAGLFIDRGSLSLGSNSETVDRFAMPDGTVTATGGGVLTVTDLIKVGAGSITAPLAGEALMLKGGNGLFTLTGNHTLTGLIRLMGGQTRFSGSIGADIEVGAGARFDAAGTIGGDLTGAGTIGIGNSWSGNGIGTLTVNGDFRPAGLVEFQINPPSITPAVHHDQMVVGGELDLHAATFSFTGGSGSVALLQMLTLIDHTSTSATVLPVSPANGGGIEIGDNHYRVFYTGGDGNDVVLVEGITPTVVYVDDSFVGGLGTRVTDADLGSSGNQFAIMGVTGFRSVAQAIAAVTTDGTIIVNSGVYTETALLDESRTMRIGGPDAAQQATITGLATLDGTQLTLAGSSTLTIGDATDRTFAGPINGAGSLVKQGAGVVTMPRTTPNSFSGGTTIRGGVLSLGSGGSTASSSVGALGAGPITVSDGGQLRLWISDSGSYTLPNNVTLSGGAVHVERGNYTLSGPVTLATAGQSGTLSSSWAGSDLTVSGKISGPGSLAVRALSGANG